MAVIGFIMLTLSKSFDAYIEFVLLWVYQLMLHQLSLWSLILCSTVIRVACEVFLTEFVLLWIYQLMLHQLSCWSLILCSTLIICIIWWILTLNSSSCGVISWCFISRPCDQCSTLLLCIIWCILTLNSSSCGSISWCFISCPCDH